MLGYQEGRQRVSLPAHKRQYAGLGLSILLGQSSERGPAHLHHP